MELNPDFADRLERTFDGRVRIRWSLQRKEWHVEYRVGRATVPKGYISSYDDRMVRARDGYAFLMAITEGDRCPCPKCGYTVNVPKFHIAEAKCEYCTLSGREGRFVACYFPLEGDSLIQHLCRLDPMRNYRTGLHLLADAANTRLMNAHERKFENDIESITKDHAKELLQIQSVGYTGKELT